MKRCFSFFLLSATSWAATAIVHVGPTQSQALVQYKTDQSGVCTIRASRGTSLGTNIPDIIDNGNSDARAGSISGQGQLRFIVLGAHKSNDALAADANYIVGLTCGTDSEVTAQFHTKPIQWGNTAPDIVPFNAAKFGNMDHPVIDWNNAASASSFCDPGTHSYCDPNTGAEYWLASRPGWATSAGIQLAQYAGSWAQPPIDISGSKWTNPGNAWFHAPSPPSYATAVGAATDKLFIPLGVINCPAGTAFNGFAGNCAIDDVSFEVWCGNATVNNVTGINLQLSIDGGQTVAGNSLTTGNCGSGAPVRLGTYPGPNPVAQPMFKSWGFIPQRNMIMPPTGTVGVTGTAVTLTGPSNASGWFNLQWATGTPIMINGAYAHLAASPTTSTSFTTQENLGTPGCSPNCSYAGAGFGVVLTKTNSSANVDVSVGLNFSYSEMPSSCCNGDNEMLNLAPVSVSRSADGSTCGIYTVGCSSGTLNPPIKGYIGYLQANSMQNAVFLWIPYNSDGSPRGETRFLSKLYKPSGSTRVVWNGDTAGAVGLSQGVFFDNSDGNSIYSQDQGNKRIWKVTYNEGYGGSCTGYQSFHPFPNQGDYDDSGHTPGEDCFTYTVLTPLAGGKDLRTQVMGSDGHSGAYQTGLNYLGQTIGPAHPGFDLGWMGNPSGPVAADGGFISVGFAAFQNGPGILASFGDDGAGKFVLKSLRNTWGEGALRWGGAHTCPIFNMGTYRFCVLDPLQDTGVNAPFSGRNKAVVSAVNHAGYGSAANWQTASTAVSSTTDFYTCPSGLPAPFTSFSGTPKCLQVRINTPFCQFSPNATYRFPDGKTEKDEFPCTTPGFGIANAAYSKLQDIQMGDWLLTEADVFGEKMVIVTVPVYNSATNIEFWVLRAAGLEYLLPTYAMGDETNGAGHGASNLSHNNGWFLWAAPPQIGMNSDSAVIDVSSPSNNWLLDNPLRFGSHGSAGFGSIPGTYNYAQSGCGSTQQFFCGSVNLTPAQHVNAPFSNFASAQPSFAGIANTNTITQTYSNATQAAAVAPLPFYVDFRALNPATGSSGQELATGFGSSFALNAVGGNATHTYQVTADCCVTNADYKRWGMQGYAGRFWLKDTSRPTTFNAPAVDMQDWSVCRAFKANECVAGSAVGNYYIAVPKHDNNTTCVSGTFGLAIPCVSAFGPWVGQAIQFRVDGSPSGAFTRKFGFAHGHLGLPYMFSNCRTTPDGGFMFCPGYWLDGVRSEWLALRTSAFLPIDTVDRTTFVPVRLGLQGVPYASNIRARFGFAENGGDLLQCTAYGQDCSTEIPSGSPNDPFSFTNETVTRQACADGANCSITIPSLPNRILYYVVDRLDGSGNVIQTSPLQAVAVP